MPEYQVIARRFRPQSFRDVIGQEAIVTTLKNAIKFNRLGHAYLFCGSRGTGKTTLARILAKALNCQQPQADFEPCNQCSSCREIASGSSLDVLEIDGASHRGIEDIRQINETVGYAATSGHYKIYIIDEVHMLTKEAFNALLKTLEEPPAKVKFFFATTEAHKVLPTILSRCQRFNLNRIPSAKIVSKLSSIAAELGIVAEEEALRLIAQRADGGLRDAESLLDQILAFEEGKATVATATSVLGLMSRDCYFDIDRAGKAGDFAKAFEIAHDVFAQGKDLLHFVEGLTEHFRHLLLTKLGSSGTPFLALSEAERERYVAASRLYSQEQCLTLIDYLIQAQEQIRFAPSGRMVLEGILLHVMRSHFRLPIEVLVKRLCELENSLGVAEEQPCTLESPRQDDHAPTKAAPIAAPILPPEPAKTTLLPKPINQVIPEPAIRYEAPPAAAPVSVSIVAAKPVSMPIPPQTPAPIPVTHPPAAPAPLLRAAPAPLAPAATVRSSSSISEDPTPSSADLGIRAAPKAVAPAPVAPARPSENATTPSEPITKKKSSQYDTLLQFAAIELEGRIQK